MPVPEARVQIQVDGVWTDITDDVKGGAELVHTRGRSGEGARVDRASVGLTLKSPDGRYYPRHPMSPYYGRLGRNTRMRHLAGGSPVTLRVGDTAAGRLATADHSSLDITGDLDLRVDAAFDAWPTTGNPLEVMSKWTNPTERSWLLTLWQSRITLYWSPDGTTQIAKASSVISARPGQRIAIRATLDVNNGSSGHTVTFYTAPTLAGPWAVLGAPAVTAGTTSVFASTAPVELGASPGTTFETVAANIFGAEIRTGVGGTVVANPDLTAQTAGATGFTDSAGRTWSTADGAEITSHRVRAAVEIPTWSPRWTVGGADMDVAIQGAGVLRRLAQGAKALESALRRRVPSYGPLAYWPMEDQSGATAAYSPIEGVFPLRVAKATFGQDASLAGSSALPTIEAGGRMVGAVPAPVGASTQWSVHMVYTLDGTPPASNGEFLAWRTSGTVRRWRILQRTGVGTIEGYDANGDLVVNQPVAVDDEDVLAGWNRYQFRVFQSGGTVSWRLSWININGDAGGFGSTYSGRAGRVTQIETTIGATVDGLRVGHLAVFPVEVTDAYAFADHGFTGETAGARALRLTTEESLPFALVGAAADTPPMGPQRPDTLLNLLLECEASDGGVLYEDRQQLGLIYRARTTLYNQEPALVLSYGKIVQPFEPVDDDTHIRNDVTRSRVGGSSVRLVQEAGPLSVQPPPAGVGVYDEAVELSLAADYQLDDVTAWALHLGTWDEARYKQVRILLHKHPELIDAAAQLDVGDLVRITDLPAYLPPGPVDLLVEGYRETLSNLSWEMILNCSPAGPWTVGVVEDPVLGRADTDGSELAGAVAATDTVLPVTVTAGPSWVTAAPNALNDPGFESDTGAWACTRGASIGVVSHETDIVHSGAGALRVTRVHPTDTGTMNLWDPASVQAAAAGQTWAGGAWVYSGGAAANNMRCAIVWRDAGGTETFVYGTAPSVSAGTWTYVSVSATLPAGAVGVRLGVEGRSTWTVGEWWIADDVRLARTDTFAGTDMGDQFPFDVTVGGEVVTVHSIGPSTSPTVSDTFTRTTLPPTVTDAFDRTATGGWGTATTGQAWTNSGGTNADYAVGSGVGTVSAGVVNSSRFTQLATLALADVDMQADVTVPVVATGASISTGLRLRAASTADYYYVEVVRATAGTISVLLVSRVAGVSTTIAAAVSKGAYAAGQSWTVRARLVGSVLQAKLWATAGTEPSGWDVQAYTTSIPTAGPVGTRTILSGGNTNALPVIATWDNVRVTAVESGWGTSTSGHAWTRSGGTAAEYTVDGGRGLIALTSVDSSRRIITGPTLADTDIRAAMTVPVVAATDSIDMAVMSRYQDSGTYYHAVLHCHADATIDVRIRKVVAGVYTTLSISSLLPGTYAAGDTYWLRFQTTGTSLQARGWRDGTAEPGTWQATATDSSITAAGQTGVRMNLQAANTNTLPVIVSVDQYEVSGPAPFHVTRSVNGIVKAQTTGTPLSLTHPMRAAL
ncbi:carbohydrate binding domain-containing protein [Streptomyces sp. wa1063]|uniref:carbohydrate binding domain-containing protein n=1 Tax=Streptomyces sp. wa1063 TaxID=1828212 RepID=UPI000BF006C4|nr:carbohydrate binding domain-containing protein [Streptomyces sp. wa1063]